MDANWRLQWNNPWARREVGAYQADRYVIAAKCADYYSKLFQVAFGSDGTIFVTLPYCRDVPGRLGLLHMTGGVTYPTTMKFGENCPITSHAVKYSHHPSGRAHFSLTGKIRSDIGKQACPLHQANGHLFTVMAQGMALFEAVGATEKGTAKRGIVPFWIDPPNPEAIKFVAHLYSRTECGRRYQGRSKSPWNLVVSQDGKSRMGIRLATPFAHNGEPFFLQLTMERIPRVNKDSDVFLSLIGGFDEPALVFDHSRDTSCLICMYPQTGDLAELLGKFGTVDLPLKP